MTPQEEAKKAGYDALATPYGDFIPYDFPSEEDFNAAIDAAFARLSELGYVVVPKEASEEMLVAGTETWLCEAAMEDRAGVCWSAMIAASPHSIHPQQGDKPKPG